MGSAEYIYENKGVSWKSGRTSNSANCRLLCWGQLWCCWCWCTLSVTGAGAGPGPSLGWHTLAALPAFLTDSHAGCQGDGRDWLGLHIPTPLNPRVSLFPYPCPPLPPPLATVGKNLAAWLAQFCCFISWGKDWSPYLTFWPYSFSPKNLFKLW